MTTNYFRYLFPKIVRAPFSKGLNMGIRGKAVYVPEIEVGTFMGNGRMTANIATFIEFVIEMPDGEVKSAMTFDTNISASIDL